MRSGEGATSEERGVPVGGSRWGRDIPGSKQAPRPLTAALVMLCAVCPLAAGGQAAATSEATHGGAAGIPAFSSLPRATMTFDRRHGLLTLDLPSTDLAPAVPGGMVMVSSPVYQAVVPASCTIHSARASVLDSAGRELPKEFLHHVHLSDPDHRDLFLAGTLHLLAASKETPSVTVPALILGLPLAQGQRLLTWDMLSNETPVAQRGVHVRLEIGCRPIGHGVLGSLFPVFRAYPWVMDAMFPNGRRAPSNRSFDLAPGRTVHSWESSPAIPGDIVGIGGHVHDYAVGLDFTDVTTGQLIWHVTPVRDSTGRVLDLPITRFYNWHRLGIHIVPSHRYRITVTYDNPTGHVIPDGGMGSVAGLFIPDRGAQWPVVNTSDPVYQQDLVELFGTGTSGGMPGMGH
jgi:hypothetical protein